MHLWADNETRVDLVGFGPLVETVAEVVTSTEMLPVTVGLFGDWGGGKTSLMAMIEDRVKIVDGFLTVDFQPWLHKDYDDVRGAFMVAIADALEAHRPIWEKAAGVAVEEGRAAFKKFRRRIDWIRCAMFAGKAIGTVAAAAHFNPLAVLTGAGALSDMTQMFPRVDMGSDGDTDKPGEGAAGLLKDDELHLASESERQQPLERTITEFRSEFGKLLEHLNITGLVVFVDDLDRCFPSTILDTIEAIRLFFAVPRTAFVIGSDERILRHALATRYPETGPEATTLGREYLEKIIQVPVRIPPLSAPEVEAYLHLLILERHLGRDDAGRNRFERLRAEALKRLHRGLGSASFNYGVIKTLYADPLPPELDADLAVVTQIAPVLAPQLKGNPRQAKRFLNTVYLRQRIAQRLGLSLELPVLAKLSALEYFEESTFARLAEWNEVAPGESEEIRALEAWASGTVEHDEVPDGLRPYANDGRFREWLRSEPKLGKTDLGPYVRFAREKLKGFGGRERVLPPDVQEILVQLLDESRAVASSARERLNDFDVGAQQLLFDALQNVYPLVSRNIFSMR